MALHSNISPSAASRWTACPGSVALTAALPPSKTSIHAAEGTACHELGEKLLKKEITKADIIKMEGRLVADAINASTTTWRRILISNGLAK